MYFLRSAVFFAVTWMMCPSATFAENNKDEVHSGYEDGWNVVWGSELGYDRQAMCVASMIASGPGGVFGCAAGLFADAVIHVGEAAVLDAIQNPGKVRNLNDQEIEADLATLQNWRQFGGRRFDLPHTFQPFIRWRDKAEPTTSR